MRNGRLVLRQQGHHQPAGVESLAALEADAPHPIEELREGIVEDYAEDAQLAGVSPHPLRHYAGSRHRRHTFCKTLLDARASLPEVAALSGHESLETTRRYCEPSIKDLERTVGLIEEEREK